MKAIRKAGALIFNDKKLLVVKPRKKPFFINPGGKYEEGENAEQCLKRELMEELGVDLISLNPFKNYNIDKAAHSDKELLLELYTVKVRGVPKPSSEIESIEWLGRKDFEQKKFNLAPSFYKFVPELIRAGLL